MFPVRILHLSDVVDLQIIMLGGADVLVAESINIMREKSLESLKKFFFAILKAPFFFFLNKFLKAVHCHILGAKTENIKMTILLVTVNIQCACACFRTTETICSCLPI